MTRITTGVNFDFIQRSFIEAKKALIEENKTGVENPDRLKGIGLEGASRTGKTWDISNFIYHYVTTYSGKQITLGRDHLSTFKKTFYKTLKAVSKPWRFDQHHFNKTASPIHYNDNVIEFVGFNDDIMTSHGLESDLLVINEAMGVPKDVFDQLEQRTKEFFIVDYNPSAVDSWLFDLEKRPDYKSLKTTVFDNWKYIPANAKQKIIGYAHPDCDDYLIAKNVGYTQEQWEKLKERNVIIGTADKYKWEVYGLGLRAVSEDVIFTKWQLYTEEPAGYDWAGYGGDFGFTNDPTTLIKVIKSGNNLFLKECIWETGLLNNEIAEKMKGNEYDDLISVWDSSEMKSVNELRSYGIPADWADKPPNSVAWGIQKMQQFNIFIHHQSENLHNEFRKYRWAKDRQGNFKRNTFGKRIPIDKNNHGIDAIRYKVTYHFDILEVENEN